LFLIGSESETGRDVSGEIQLHQVRALPDGQTTDRFLGTIFTVVITHHEPFCRLHSMARILSTVRPCRYRPLSSRSVFNLMCLTMSNIFLLSRTRTHTTHTSALIPHAHPCVCEYTCKEEIGRLSSLRCAGNVYYHRTRMCACTLKFLKKSKKNITSQWTTLPLDHNSNRRHRKSAWATEGWTTEGRGGRRMGWRYKKRRC
jgi:hypothetical protein